MFNYEKLIVKILCYGFKKLCKKSSIPLIRLIEILDGDKYFSIDEIDRISRVLGIKSLEKEYYFFMPKVD